MDRTEGATLHGVQHLRAAAALAVVLFHAGGSVASVKYQGNAAIGTLTGGLDAGVDLFFVVSGFVVALPLFRGPGRTPARFLFARLARVYPLAILTATLCLAAGALVGTWPDDPVRVALSSALLVPAPVAPVPIVLWTLKQEVLFYLLFAAAFVDRRAGLALVAAWAVASLLAQPTHYVARWFFHVQNVEFLFGIAAAALWARRPAGAGAAPLALAAAAAFLALAAATGAASPGPRIEAVGFGALGATLVYAMASLPLRPVWSLKLVGAASYAIYLVHFAFVSAANRATVRLDVPDAAAFALVAAAAVAGGLLYHALAERPLERWRRRAEARLFAPRAIPSGVAA